MFKVIEKEKDIVLVKMDINTYNWLNNEINEDISNYEFIFDKPIKASKLINN